MNKLQKDAIAHYNRMIKWAKTQSQDISPHPIAMKFEIGEMWGSDDCSYCMTYRCDDCPLSKFTGPEFFGCCNKLWRKMDTASTWSEWIEYAKKIKQYIKDNG